MNFRPLPCILALALAALSPACKSPNLAQRLNRSFVNVAARVSPAVVVITVTEKPGAESLASLGDSEDGQMPRDELHKQFKSIGQGSGVFIRKNGYILTNRHVVEDAEKIEVRLKDGRRFPATLRGLDRQSDVAVIQIDAKDLPVAKLADSDKTQVGEFAIAIGAPFNLDYSVTFGHVSAKSRANIVPSFNGEVMRDQDFIQTDANINPGNSGGPLVNIDGEVIGINTLIRGLRTGIGFAIPSTLARQVSDQIVATGKFARPWLGVSLLGVREDAQYAELAKRVDDGVIIQEIVAGGPASKSELRLGDIITRVDGRRVGSAQELRNQIRSKTIGQPVALQVVRDDQSLTLHVSPGEYIEPAPVFASVTPRSLRATDLGLKIGPFTDELSQQFGIEKTDGVVVTEVAEESPADQSGLRPGDVITSLNDQNTFSAAQFREALQSASLKDGIRLTTLVKGKPTAAVLKAR